MKTPLPVARGYFTIGVEGISKAVNLGNLLRSAHAFPTFPHPQRAAYVLGPERGALTPELAARYQHLVRIPSTFSLNVATAGAIVMYDRLRALGALCRASRRRRCRGLAALAACAGRSAQAKAGLTHRFSRRRIEMSGVRPRSPIGGGNMHRAVRALGIAVALVATPALAQEVTLLEKFKDWTAYAGTGTPKVCFAVSKPTDSNPKKIKRGPILFYISQWPADKVVNEVSVKMGYPFSEGAKTTVTVGSEKFELFTKDEGAFVEKPEMETKLIEAMKSGNTMKIEGKSSRGTATTDVYSLNGLSDALDRAVKECSG